MVASHQTAATESHQRQVAGFRNAAGHQATKGSSQASVPASPTDKLKATLLPVIHPHPCFRLVNTQRLSNGMTIGNNLYITIHDF
jgi:hypothetical protein